MKKDKSLTDDVSKTALPKWVIFFVIISLLALGLAVNKAMQKRRVSDKLKSYQDQGLPVTFTDLKQWAPSVPPENNAAPKLIEAIEHFVDWSSKPLPNDPNLSTRFPLLDFAAGNIKQVDIPPENWDQKNEYFLPALGCSRLPEPGEPVDEFTKQSIAEFLDENSLAMQLLHEAAKCKQFRSIDYSLSYDAQPGLGELPLSLITAARRLQLESMLHLENAQFESAAQSVFASYRLAHAVFQEPLLINCLVGMVCSDYSCKNLEYTLNRRPMSRARLHDIAAVISDIQSTPWFQRALQAERCSIIDNITQPYSLTLSYQILDLVGLWDVNILHYLDSKDQLIAVLDLPISEQVPAVQALEDRARNLSRFYILESLVQPSYYKYFAKNISYQVNLHIARTVVALEEYRLAHGSQLPTKLDQLVPEYIEVLPVDLYGGTHIRYRVIDGGYIVYSVGEDYKDDGGIPDSDIVFTVKRK